MDSKGHEVGGFPDMESYLQFQFVLTLLIFKSLERRAEDNIEAYTEYVKYWGRLQMIDELLKTLKKGSSE